MLNEKIIELFGYNKSLEEITAVCLNLYNKNFYEIDNFKPMNYDSMFVFVKNAILLHNIIIG